jgi:peptide/nickel transport system permease protein
MHSANYEDMSWPGKMADVARHLVVPTLVLSLGSIASLQRLMRGNMLAQLRQQYVVAARAKGLPEEKIIYRHAYAMLLTP